MVIKKKKVVLWTSVQTKEAASKTNKKKATISITENCKTEKEGVKLENFLSIRKKEVKVGVLSTAAHTHTH